MTSRDILQREFNGEEGSFVFRARNELAWDWNAFRTLTSAMYDVADEARQKDIIETWIAQGFWFCDTWIRDFTSQPNFPRPDQQAYDDAIGLINDLAHFLFIGEAADNLKNEAKG